MNELTTNGRTVSWRDKLFDHQQDGVLYFKDGDWFNTATGSGTHRYGMLSVTGQSVIAHPHLGGGSSTATRTGMYAVEFPRQ